MRQLFTLFILLFCVLSVHSQKMVTPNDFYTSGDAVKTGSDCIRLTSASNWSAGSIWYKDAIDLRQSFDMQLELMMGCQDRAGADGIVFVFHPERIRTGYAGEGMGFAGLVPSIGVEVDTWENNHLGDPSEDHIAVLQNGRVGHYNNLAGPVVIENVETCSNQTFRIIWEANKKTLSIYLNGKRRIELKNDIVNTIFYGKSQVYWGVTAATGKYNNRHEICLKKLEFGKITPLSLFDDPRSVTSLMKGKRTTLQTVKFPSGQSRLQPEALQELNRLAVELKKKPNATIEIGGFTDNVGDAGRNQQLSQRRADAVRKYLIQKGIPSKRIYSKGYGERDPISSNNTATGREKNRRVTVRVIEPIV